MTNQTTPITGGCLCGAVRFESTEPPRDVGVCHCRMCQRSSGSPHMVWAFFSWRSFRFTRGEPVYYRSSRAAERGHCGACGSPLIYRDKTEHAYVPIGALDHPEDWPPTLAHGGMESRLPWDAITDDLPRYTTAQDPIVQRSFAATKQADDR